MPERAGGLFLSEKRHPSIALSHKVVVYSIHVVLGSLGVIRRALRNELFRHLAEQQTCDLNVVFESTVYPGCTEEDCIPILEKESGLTFKKDFKVGYSPERINPGDKEHTVEKLNIANLINPIN